MKYILYLNHRSHREVGSFLVVMVSSRTDLLIDSGGVCCNLVVES